MNKIKKNGEVFTPPKLVKDMLDLIKPETIKPTSKILDPCSGATCIFPILYLIKAVRIFGVQYIKIINDNLYGVELDLVAYEYSKILYKKYYDMIIELGPDFAEEDYINNFEKIKKDYYELCK